MVEYAATLLCRAGGLGLLALSEPLGGVAEGGDMVRWSRIPSASQLSAAYDSHQTCELVLCWRCQMEETMVLVRAGSH